MAELDKGFEIFLNWQTALFCLGIYFITYVVRLFVEALVPGAKVKGTTSHRLWTELFLPLGPYGTGMIIALFAKKFPWPMPVTDVLSVKIMYGLVCGGASGWIYGRFRGFMKTGADAKLGAAPAAPELPAAPAEAAEMPSAEPSAEITLPAPVKPTPVPDTTPKA